MTDLIIEIRYYERGGWCNLFIHNHKLHIHHFLLALTVIANYGCAELISSYYQLPIDWIKYDNIIDLYGRTTFTGMHCGLLFYINSYIGCPGCCSLLCFQEMSAQYGQIKYVSISFVNNF